MFFAYASFTDVHTGETNEISIRTSTRERKKILFLVLVLVLISRMFKLRFFCAYAGACAYLTSVNQANVHTREISTRK